MHVYFEAMSLPQIRLATLLLLSGAVPIWLYLCVIVPMSPAFGRGNIRFFLAPFVLLGMTCAVQRLFRSYPHSWAVAALCAGLIAIGSLQVATFLSR
jgi:hypothetical protein